MRGQRTGTRAVDFERAYCERARIPFAATHLEDLSAGQSSRPAKTIAPDGLLILINLPMENLKRVKGRAGCKLRPVLFTL